MSLESINKVLAGGNYSKLLCYSVKEVDGAFELCVEAHDSKKDVWKRADPWGFAAFHHASNDLKKLRTLRFAMRTPQKNKGEEQHYESFKRRLSYLAEINKRELSIALSVGGKEEGLYTMAKLAERPKNEVLRDKIVPRKNYKLSGRKEKDLQAFLIGMNCPEDIKKEKPTNKRLALFGEDFVDNQNLRVEREFPTGVFDNVVSKETRILPAEYVDFVTINKHGEIAIIELKVNDNQLEVIAQLLNYILFFYSYITNKNLISILEKHLECEPANVDITAYLVSNVFHPRLDEIWPYYFKNEPFSMPNGRHMKIKIQQV